MYRIPDRKDLWKLKVCSCLSFVGRQSQPEQVGPTPQSCLLLLNTTTEGEGAGSLTATHLLPLFQESKGTLTDTLSHSTVHKQSKLTKDLRSKGSFLNWLVLGTHFSPRSEVINNNHVFRLIQEHLFNL